MIKLLLLVVMTVCFSISYANLTPMERIVNVRISNQTDQTLVLNTALESNYLGHACAKAEYATVSYLQPHSSQYYKINITQCGYSITPFIFQATYSLIITNKPIKIPIVWFICSSEIAGCSFSSSGFPVTMPGGNKLCYFSPSSALWAIKFYSC